LSVEDSIPFYSEKGCPIYWF